MSLGLDLGVTHKFYDGTEKFLRPEGTRCSAMKRFYVKELAQACGISPDAVRYYVQVGLLAPKRDATNRYQLFGGSDVNRVHFIRRAKRLGYTLREIRHIFEESGKGKSPCPFVREVIQRRIVENRHQIEHDMLLQERMEQALKQWQTMPNGVPDGDSVCRLIESVLQP